MNRRFVDRVRPTEFRFGSDGPGRDGDGDGNGDGDGDGDARATRWMKMRPLTSTNDSCARERWCETRESDETDDSTPRA